MHFLWVMITTLSLLSAPALANADEVGGQLAGAWVTAEVRRALDEGSPVEVGCHLDIRMGPLRIEERCGEDRQRWSSSEVSQRPGAIEVRGTGGRRIVNRAGTPGELELTSSGSLRRLYRVSPSQEELLAEWAMLPPQAPSGLEQEELPDAAEREVEVLPPASSGEPIVAKPRLLGCSAGQVGGPGAALVAAWWWIHTQRRRRGAQRS